MVTMILMLAVVMMPVVGLVMVVFPDDCVS